MAAVMTDVEVPIADGTDNWTLIYTAGGAIDVTVHNRSPNVDLLIRVDGSSGATDDELDAAAEWLYPFARSTLTLANGDLLYARPVRDEMDGRVTVRV